MRDVVVLGWWGERQQRIDFVRLLQDELALGVAPAKTMLDESLETGAPVVIPVSPSRRAHEVGVAIESMGATVRVLDGHGALARSPASLQLARIRQELDGLLRSRTEVRAAVNGICPELRASAARTTPPTTAAELYAVARENCAFSNQALRPQSADDWSGPFELPPALRDFYALFGPDSLNLESYGNPFQFPALKDLWEYQVGYRSHGLTGAPLPDWDDDLLVIADDGADPFALSRERGTVLHAQHGAGRWDFEELFASPAALAAALTGISQICASAGKDELVDAESLIKPFWWARLMAEMADVVGSPAAATRVFEVIGML